MNEFKLLKIGSSIESTKTSKSGENGTRRIVTRIVRKTTTLTRGEEKSVAEDLTNHGQIKSIQAEQYSKVVQGSTQSSPKTKSVRVRFQFFKKIYEINKLTKIYLI